MAVGVLKVRDPATGAWLNIAGVGSPGPAGPAGPAGPPGGTGPENYVHDQLVPAATWVITHPLNKMGAVQIVDSAGTVIVPDIRYDSLSQITVTFGSATIGTSVRQLMLAQVMTIRIRLTAARGHDRHPDRPARRATQGDPLVGVLKARTSPGAATWVSIATTGPPGPQGPEGVSGPVGPPGEKWFTGLGAPTTTTPATAVIGDWYLDNAPPGDPGSGDYYEKMQAADPGAWALRGNLAGPPGGTGISSIIVGNFGAVATPADLPIDGLIPIDWDGPGNPSAPRQMLIGECLYYDKTGDPLDGHLFQYVSTSMEPTGWLDIGLIQGPPGPDGTPGEKWFTAPGVPDATTPVGAVIGDWYIDSTAGDYYEKMQVNDPGAWVLRGNLTGPPGDEVWIGPDAPPTNIPELWYDTDDTRILGPVDLPTGGLTHDALVKTTDLDGDVQWRNIYSVPSGKVIQFPNAEGAKINLYCTTFGLGISASTLNLFSNGNISFGRTRSLASGGATSTPPASTSSATTSSPTPTAWASKCRAAPTSTSRPAADWCCAAPPTPPRVSHRGQRRRSTAGTSPPNPTPKQRSRTTPPTATPPAPAKTTFSTTTPSSAGTCRSHPGCYGRTPGRNSYPPTATPTSCGPQE